jgi:hypothetical protein
MCGAIVSGLHSISMDERYIAKSTWMCGYAQDVRYFAGEHMDVRREACQFCTAHQCGAIVHGLHSMPLVCAVRLFMVCTMPRQSRPATPFPPTRPREYPQVRRRHTVHGLRQPLDWSPVSPSLAATGVINNILLQKNKNPTKETTGPIPINCYFQNHQQSHEKQKTSQSQPEKRAGFTSESNLPGYFCNRRSKTPVFGFSLRPIDDQTS